MLIPFLLLLGVACRDSTPLGPDPHAAFPLTSSAGTLIAATDFSEYPPGQQPSDWTRRWTAGGTVSWTVQRDSAGAFAGHSKLVLQVSSGEGATRGLSWDRVGERSHVRVHTRLRMAAVTDHLAGVTVLGGGVAGKENGYGWGVHRTSTFTGLRLARIVGGKNQTTLASHAMSLSANTFYHLVLEKQGDTLRAKAWPDGAAEPAWQVEAVDTLLKSGWAGFSNFSPGTVEFDFLRAYDPAAQGSPVPALPPDSTPRAVLEEILQEENRVYYSEHHRNWYLRNVIRLYFQEGTPQPLRQEAIDLIGGEVIGGHRLVADGGLYLIRIQDDGTATPLWNAIEQLRALPHVYSAGPFYHFVIQPRYRRPKDEGQWVSWKLRPELADGENAALEAIAAPLAWGCENGSASAAVAITDVGFSSPQDLAANVSSALGQWAPSSASRYHGTAVASVVGAVGNNEHRMTGVMWNAELRLYDYVQTAVALPRDDAGDREATVVDLVGGANSILRAAAEGAKVINISWGPGWSTEEGYPSGYIPGEEPHYSADTLRVREYERTILRETAAQLRKVVKTTDSIPLLVIAAGNEEVNAFFAANTLLANIFPDRVLVVGAATHTGNGNFAAWKASEQRGNFRGSNYGSLVNIAAPGGNAYVLGGDNTVYARQSTSFAAPYVTGVAGLLLSFDPALTPAQVKDLIVQGASRGGRTMPNLSGNPIPVLNAYESLKAAAEEHGRPLCGNRVWGADGTIWAQRGSGPPEDLRTISGAGAHHLQVLHGGKHLTYASTTGGEELQWNPQTRRFQPGPVPPVVEWGGTYLSVMGYDHDSETFGWIDDREVNDGRWYETASQAQAPVRRGPPGGPFTTFSTLTVNNLPENLENICLERSSDGTCWLTLLESRRWLLRLAYPQHDRQPFSLMVSPFRVTPVDSTEWTPCSFNAQRQCRHVQTLQRHLGTRVYTIDQAGGDPVPVTSVQEENSIFWVGLSESDSTQVLSQGRWKITVWNDPARYYSTGSPYYNSEKEVEQCALHFGAQQPFALGQPIATKEACYWDSWRYPDYGGGGTVAPSREPLGLTPQAQSLPASGPISLPMPVIGPTRVLTPSPLQPVPRLPDGEDVAGRGGVLLQLAAQLGDVHVYRAGHHRRAVAPHLLQQLES